MFQNSYQNGAYFELFDPKGNLCLTQLHKTKQKIYSNYKM